MDENTTLKPGGKPPVGAGGGNGLFNGGYIYQYDKDGFAIDRRGGGGVNFNSEARNATVDEKRIGDYYYENGQLKVVPNSATDFYNRYHYTNDKGLSAKPKESDYVKMFDALVPGATGGVAGTATGAVASAVRGGSAIVGGVGAAIPATLFEVFNSVATVDSQRAAYKDALEKWEEEQKDANWKVAGTTRKDEEGNIYFTPDVSLATDANSMYQGTAIVDAENKETNVYFGDDGRLKVVVDPIFASTDQYKDLIDLVKEGYAGLTPDSEQAEQAIADIKQAIDTRKDQFAFRKQAHTLYRTQVPNASDAAIDEAHLSELGAYVSENEGKTIDVKVYRNGSVTDSTAADVLGNVFNMDKGKRSDYMLSLWNKMEDPNISDDDKAYIYGEIRLLEAASDNDRTYENGQEDENGGAVKTVNKYKGMLDRDWIAQVANTRWAFVTPGELSNALNNITPWDMNYNDQRGLKQDEALSSALTAISAATNAVASYWAMNKIEHGIVRPLVSKLGGAVNRGFENLAANGGRLSNLVGSAQMIAGQIGDKVSGIAALTSPFAKGLGYSITELTYNATSDLIFDITRAGIRAFAGEEDAWDEFGMDFAGDLVMDLVIQYGPMGLYGVKSELQNERIEAAYAPYKKSFEKARYDFDAAELEYQTVKNELSDMRKGTKKYAAKEAELKEKDKALANAEKEYQSQRVEVEAAVREAMPDFSEELGAALAGKVAKLESNNVLMWLRKKFTDEKAALSVVAEQAYAKTEDVYLYQAAVNKFQSTLSVTKEVLNKLNNDVYTKGVGDSWAKFATAVTTAAPNAKFSKAQIDYMVALTRLETFTRINKSDPEEVKKARELYEPYINAMQGAEKQNLDNLLSAMKQYLAKVGEAYIRSGAATQESVKDIQDAAFGDGYIPLWGNKKYRQMNENFELPKTLSVGRTFDIEQGMFDVKNTVNPVEATMTYVQHIANNIARNEMAAQLYELAQIDDLGIKLVGNGAVGVNKETQQLIDNVLNKVAKNEEKIINNSVSADKYQKGMEPILDFKAGDNIEGKMNDLSSNQKKLRDLNKNLRFETDANKRTKIQRQIQNLTNKMANQRIELRQDVDNRIRQAGEYFNKTYKKFGLTVDIENTLSSKDYSDWVNSRIRSGSERSMSLLKAELSRQINSIAPYLPIKKLNTKLLNKEVAGFRKHAENSYKKTHPDWSEKKVKAEVNRATAEFRRQYAGNGATQQSPEEFSGGGYKIDFMQNNKDASFYITGKLAQEVAAEMNSSTVIDRNILMEVVREAANIKRLLTTGIDPTRVLPNLFRDTIRSAIFSGGSDYWVSDNSPFGFRAMFDKYAKAQGLSDEQVNRVLDTLKAAQEVASQSTYNEAFTTRNRNLLPWSASPRVKQIVEYSLEQGSHRGTRFVWNVAHNKRGLLETPMNAAEAFTRNRAASGAFWETYFKGAGVVDEDIRLKNAYEAGLNAGRENTMNFSRRGEWIAKLGSYVPYFSQNFSSIESAKISFLKDPVGVSTRLMMFGMAYMMELSRTLANEKARKNYYNLSEYDRNNNIIISLSDGALITIPLDESVSAIIYPWRRGIETMRNVDPQDFYAILIGGMLELSPLDLTGFGEGGQFNLGRGLEKLGAQALPTVMQSIYTQATGRNMFFGSTAEVTKDTLAEYGNYDPSWADYTTRSANSKTLGAVANAFGVPQWRLQQMVSDLGGNVGQYIVNMLDKLAGAAQDEQGGKDFVEATFKSFTGMDSNQTYYAFTDGIARLEEQKEKVKSELKGINAKIELASGDKLAELQKEFQKKKEDFAMDVYNFVEKYINAYEITGGLDKNLANKIWYLVNFADDDSLAAGKSVESYYRDLARKQANNQATSLSAKTLDKFYDQTQNIYRDSEGVWHYSSPYGEQAFFNTIYGQGMRHQVGLRNIIEGDVENLSAERSATYDARSKAADAGDWNTYNKLGAAFDEKLVNAIEPYVKKYGAEAVIGNSTVLDYLEEWIFVPDSFMKTKRGKNVSLGNNASKNRAFARPYLKKLFGLSTGYNGSNYVSRPENLVWEEGEE